MRNGQSRFGLFAAIALLAGAVAQGAEAMNFEARSAAAHKLADQGNFKEAYDALKPMLLDKAYRGSGAGLDLHKAAECLAHLNRIKEFDDLAEAAIKAHADDWRFLAGAATCYRNASHEGFEIAGKFERGPHRGGGNIKHAFLRDRGRSLQLFHQALPLAMKDDSRNEVADFLFQFADALAQPMSWRLQALTDFAVLPDYEDGWPNYSDRAAPADADGNPIYYYAPRTFEAAKNDGERWRWCLAQAGEASAAWADQATMRLADFLRDQFDVQTLADYGRFFGGDDDAQPNQTFALHLLGEDETIARLASGVKRFKLPPEFQFIRLYRELTARPGGSGYQTSAWSNLATIFENRRQYPKAVECWREYLKLDNADWAKARLEQIVGNWGEFEPVTSQPAGRGATAEFRFRNTKGVQFTAWQIDIEKLLTDVKEYLKTSPKELRWDRINIDNVGYRLIDENQRRYLGPQVASWRMELKPRENHFDRRVTVTTPLQKGGAYLLTAQVDGGNRSHIVLWVADMVIARKPMEGKTLYYVAEADSGKPVAKANVEFFGWQNRWENGHSSLTIKNFAEFSSADGLVQCARRDMPENFQWLAMARTTDGKMAFLGFSHAWYGARRWEGYNMVKTFTMTDRPVYRPGQKVHFKLWIGNPRYDNEGPSSFAGRSFQVMIRNPKNEKLFDKSLVADEYGGVEGEIDLPKDAALGAYWVGTDKHGGGNFRVEEYKKPEFEVSVDAPAVPVQLGEKFTATIKAKYYFGSPVTKARVKYKVERSPKTDRWYPVCGWDWFYGPGYWWFAYDYTWLPGWRSWGLCRPVFSWWPHFDRNPPEVVAEQEAELGPDGTLKVEVDTTMAKLSHPNDDHRYTITAEVVDQSRRTIVGSGSVLAARRPFSVTAWVDRGHYRVGDVVDASFAARTADGKPVRGAGVLKVLRLSYRDGKAVETPVQDWELPTNEEGMARLHIKASHAGQYRLSYTVTDAAKHSIEGGYVFTIVGPGFDGADFRFQHLELVPDQREYRPGDRVKLMVNTDRAGATVLLFLRPANGQYLPPQVLHPTGKSSMVEVTIEKNDMPNFFIEAVTVADGKVYSEVREIVVPPEKRILNVDVKPSAEAYQPGEKATVQIKLTDLDGKPFVGSAVVSIYDKAVEYISGGSNVANIKEFFWKWRRHHQAHTESNANRWSNNQTDPNKPGMSGIGAFGDSVAADMDDVDRESSTAAPAMRKNMASMLGRGMGGGMGGMGGMAVPMAAPRSAVMSDKLAKAETAADASALPAPAEEPPQANAAEVQPTVRSQFADTALWVGKLETGPDGTAQVPLNMPENLTTWRIKTWAMGGGTRVGEGFADVVTRKDLIVRLQAPRFFIQTDEVVLSANVHNYLKSAKKVRVVLELDGQQLAAQGELSKQVEVPSQGEARVDWRVRVRNEGEAVVRVKALTDEQSDAMELRVPAYVHGMLKTDSYCGVIRPQQGEGKFVINVPEARRVEQSRLELRYSPTLAGAMVDALPYLIDYPYGCTEQTLSRFLPAVITQKVLLQKGVSLKDIQAKRTNLNAQEIGDDRERAAQWKTYKHNPVFDEEELRRIVKAGITRLSEMQCSDGGWGWFSGYGEHSSPHTTAYVVHGLQIAQQNDVALLPGMLDRGVAWLQRYQNRQIELLKNAAKKPRPTDWKDRADNNDALVYMVLADAGVKNADMLAFLDRDRTHLAVYGLAMYGMALDKQGEKEKLAMVLRNLGQYVAQDNENQTAWLNLPQNNWWWCWYGSEYEAQAYYLKLLARTDPRGETASRLVKYLLNNRKNATYWNSTRDTAVVVEAMADYLKASGEDRPEMTVEVYFDGKLLKAVEITPQTLFDFDNKVVLEGANVPAGKHTVELKRKGQGPVYFNGYLTNFTTEDFITKAGLEVKVERRYFRLTKADKKIQVAGGHGQVVEQKVEKYDRTELANLAQVTSGDLVEIELVIESKNDYEYLVFEDMKAAGFEPVELQSGYNGNALGAYVEFRDNRVAFFVRQLAQGRHSVSYRMRAETPGSFSALPTRGWAMYAPELKANSDELKIRVEDAPGK